MSESPELRLLFHRLNNQLGIILAHAELLEPKLPDDAIALAPPKWWRARSKRWHRQTNPQRHSARSHPRISL